MTTVIEKVYLPGTNNLANSSTDFEDLEDSILFYNPKVLYYDNSPQWTFKREIDGVRMYTSNVDKSICELSNK
jgi:hypothetical protein